MIVLETSCSPFLSAGRIRWYNPQHGAGRSRYRPACPFVPRPYTRGPRDRYSRSGVRMMPVYVCFCGDCDNLAYQQLGQPPFVAKDAFGRAWLCVETAQTEIAPGLP